MKIKIEEKWLNGDEISNGYIFDFSGERIFPKRIDAIIEILKKKKNSIIHLGCTDHLDLIDKKIQNGTWLHKIITDNSESCIGFDINELAVKHCNEIGWGNVFHADMIGEVGKCKSILNENAFRMNSKEKVYDYIIAGEVLEHTDNPVAFLKAINELYYDIVDKIIITVPNVLRPSVFKDALHGFEGINTDHRYWFTPYTICKVAYMAGLIPEELFFAGDYFTGKKSLLLNCNIKLNTLSYDY